MATSEEILKGLKAPLKIEDVDFRVQSISASGWATVISYKDARVDANRLDQVCGLNWQNDFKIIDGKMYGGIGIKIDEEWMWRWDVGTESNQDAQKGQASDAFKRAGFKWGIGRELYDYPFILVQLRPEEFTPEGNKAKATNKLRIKDWVWTAEFNDAGIPKKLVATEKGVVRFTFPKSGSQQQTPAPPQAPQNNQTAASAPAAASNSKAKPTPPADADKKWLNVTDGKKNFTLEWQNIQRAVLNKTIKSLDDVRIWYKVSKDVGEKITELLNTQNKAA